MSRPRAGHGWTMIGLVDYLRNDAGEWIPAGCARGWSRCTRCRRPHERTYSPDLCWCCFIYRAYTRGAKDDPEVRKAWEISSEITMRTAFVRPAPPPPGIHVHSKTMNRQTPNVER